MVSIPTIMLVQLFVDSSTHYLTHSLIHWFVDCLRQLCMNRFMPFHWHLNHHLLIRRCTSQLKHFVASASQKSSYRPSSSYSGFIFPKLPPRHGPGTAGKDTGWGAQRLAGRGAHIHSHDCTACAIRMPLCTGTAWQECILHHAYNELSGHSTLHCKIILFTAIR